MTAEQLQSYLMQRTVVDSPDAWPGWLITLALTWLGLCALLTLHALLHRRRRHPPARRRDAERLYLYPSALRLWHLLNALLFLFLLFSGLLLHAAPLPLAATRWLVHWHPYAGYLLLGLWCGFILLNALGANGVHYRIRWRGIAARCRCQAHFYLFGIFRAAPHPFHASPTQKFNPLQQLGYCAVMYLMVPALLLSGLGLAHPLFLPEGTAYWVLQGHLLLSFFILMFISVHIYLCTLGDTPGATFMAMVDGYHRRHAAENK
ncbi:thiosulfate reductase cytochrome B subunit [Edwardsiella piscicida]|uniref:thiosulfate reductase cytochrome B subunit n=1 Tax=Edwardsiella piscicida TaxID=1263550 RepID=UPI0029105ACA|nr:thiosulfate reductase cytochrome B subunit [Edwardsiella piscicida]ELM3722961.1 thiosulfate reductase cytochrome B subunit [Edwardsiella piscicida]ELM3729312.1 thiosulfate reductase cytochrome B subunit [Edwardsiella piscicida]ELV7536440.1 thiosulfate reductase cytochrome B subunit [Edwardsiella piscicida]